MQAVMFLRQVIDNEKYGGMVLINFVKFAVPNINLRNLYNYVFCIRLLNSDLLFIFLGKPSPNFDSICLCSPFWDLPCIEVTSAIYSY